MSDTVTLRMDERLLQRVDRLVDAGEFKNRSEALREGARRLCLETELRDRMKCDEDAGTATTEGER